MDKKSIIGLVLIGAILITWMVWSQPSAKELAEKKAQFTEDSIAQFKTDEKIKNYTCFLRSVASE